MTIIKVDINDKKYKLKFKIRRGVGDDSVLKEIFHTKTYTKKDFDIKEGEVWLDAGAHIGSFTIYALLKGVKKIYSFEPFKESYDLFQTNLNNNKKLYNIKKVKSFNKAVDIKTGTQKLYLARKPSGNQLTPVSTRKTATIKSINIFNFLKKHQDINCIKLDIEGTEMPILENITNWYNIKKIIFEYHFKADASMKRYYNIVRKLKKDGFKMNYRKFDRKIKQFNFYPNIFLLYGVRK